MEHLSHATRREYQKMGKVLSEAELDSSHGAEQPALGAPGGRRQSGRAGVRTE